MSLFTTITTVSAEQTAAQKALQLAQLKQRVLQSSQKMLQNLDSQYRYAMNSIWNNGYSTPSEAVAALGTDAAVLFRGSSQMSAFIASQYALAGVPYTPYALPANVTITVNPDGTVTLS